MRRLRGLFGKSGSLWVMALVIAAGVVLSAVAQADDSSYSSVDRADDWPLWAPTQYATLMIGGARLEPSALQRNRWLVPSAVYLQLRMADGLGEEESYLVGRSSVDDGLALSLGVGLAARKNLLLHGADGRSLLPSLRDSDPYFSMSVGRRW